MSRNIVIVVIILILAAVAGYLVWLRAKLIPQFTSEVQRVEDIEQSPLPEVTAKASIAPIIATPSAKLSPGKSASPSATPKK